MNTGGGQEAMRPPTAEEVALKRTTDCVYFLASPLTCKKGNECEYRHSEGARLNPRDCWYWLNSTCLNPKCSFRHPPLEGSPGMPSGPTLALTTHAAPTQKTITCYYFQKGLCLKGDWCPFMHGQPSTGNPVSQQVANGTTNTESSLKLKNDSVALQKCVTQPNIFIASCEKLDEVPQPAGKMALKTDNILNNKSSSRENLLALHLHDEFPKPHSFLIPVSDGNATIKPFDYEDEAADEHLHNGREADEFLPESSPGFDVLVDDDNENIDYFPNEDEFGSSSAVNDFEYHQAGYEGVAGFEMDQYNGVSEYDRYSNLQKHHRWEQRRTSSERVMDRELFHGRRIREESLDKMDGSDLRHQLLKRKRLNGSRPNVSPDHGGDFWKDDHYVEERYHDHKVRRDRQGFPPERSRLQGRITFPRRPSPDVPTDHRYERDRDRGRHRGRLSVPRPINYHGRHHHGRARWRPNEDFTADIRDSGGQEIGKDGAVSLDFPGPKSLAELKGAKGMQSSQEQPADSSDGTLDKVMDDKESGGSLLLEGRTPHAIILQGKGNANPGNGVVDFTVPAAAAAAAADTNSRLTNEESRETNQVLANFDGAEGGNPREDGNMEEKQHLENGGEIYGSFEYNEAGGDRVKAEDDENMYREDESEDEDDFAKKVVGMFSRT